ncbi:MAG: hypothetical protein ACRDKJ_12535, partial [Actinomycetota bacterium]
MDRPTRRGAHLAVVVMFAAAALYTGGEAQARPVHHAGVVVQHGDLGTLTDCVAFTGNQIDGVQLLELSRFDYRSARFPEGTGICWIDGEGCRTNNPDECFCTPAFGTLASWSYWVQERGDDVIQHGETYPSGRIIRDGSVDYWTFGPHGMPPASLHSIGDICGSRTGISDDGAKRLAPLNIAAPARAR